MKSFKQYYLEAQNLENFQRDISPTSSVILKNLSGQTLILQRGSTAPWMPNKWGLPGGAIEKNESAEEAANRECEEEISLTPKNLKFLEKINYPDYTIHLFSGEISGDPELNFEHSNFAFINRSDLNKYDLVPGLFTLLEKYM